MKAIRPAGAIVEHHLIVRAVGCGIAIPDCSLQAYPSHQLRGFRVFDGRSGRRGPERAAYECGGCQYAAYQ